MKDGFDVLVVGSGAGGGTLACSLSAAGHRVLVLERGPRYRREDYLHDEVAITRRDFFLPAFDEDIHILQRAGSAAPEPTLLGWVGNCVGGGTVQMAGYFYRFHPDDFRLRSRWGEHEAIADWPFGYDELEPYYSRVEWEVGVSGSAGTNPFEGPRSRPYPMPPLDTHALAGPLAEACRRLGLHPFPTPRAINSRPYGGRPACSYCTLCPGYGCATGAKGSSQETFLARAEATGRCEVRPDAMVREITAGADGRATGCMYLDAAGAEHRVHARVVCVCCSAVETARLLLLSRSPRFPDGLANGNGLVGRNLQFHGFSNGRGRFRFDRHPELPLAGPQPFLGCSVMDHYFLPDGVADLPKGGILRFGFFGGGPVATALRLSEDGAGGRIWGEALQRRLREHFLESRMVDFEVFHDFLPNDRTYVALDPQARDRWGLPVARIHLDELEHQRRAGAWLVDRGLEVLRAMGADEVGAEEIGASAPFLVLGTCRAGHDPAASVVDGHGRAHEVPNLFVADGSVFPTSGGGPPTLTIMAQALRTAEHIDRLAGRGEL